MLNILLLSSITAISFPGVEATLSDSISSNVSLDGVEVISTVKENSQMRQLAFSSSLISKQQLSDNHITSLKGVSVIVPNFFMPDYGSHLTSAIYIRGIGSRINTPAVGMYVDNIPYVDKTAFDFNFQGIERVDVLRGPQGTLYGRNAMGGIVRIYTKNPFAYEGTDINLGFASGDMHRTASITHYQRSNDNLAFSVGGYYDGGNGFFDNTTTGTKADKMQSAGGRFRAIFKANDRLNIDFSTNYEYNNEGAYPYFFVGNEGENAISYDDRIICNNRESKYRRGLFNVGANLEYTSKQFILNAITSYQHISDRMFMDQDFTAADIYTLEQKQRINTFNEEITFKNANRNALWQWVSGANVMLQGVKTNGPVTFYDEGVSTLIEKNTNSVFESLREQNPRMPMMSLAVKDREFTVPSDMSTPVTDFAVFHQSSINVGDFTFTGGLRLEYEKLRLDYFSNGDVSFDFNIQMSPVASQTFPDIKAQPLLEGSLDDDDLQILPKLSAMYRLPNSIGNIYATASKGYRSGGYNIQMFSDIIQGLMRSEMMSGINTVGNGVVERMLGTEKYQAMTATADVNCVVFKPEYSWNYELGTHLNLAERQLQIDASAFLINTYDQQIARFAPTGLGRMMVNAGKSRSYGAELIALWRPTPHWTFSTNYGYTHAKFTDYDAGDNNDYTGNYVPFVPKHTFNASAAHTWNLEKCNWANSLTAGLDFSGAGSIYWTEDNSISQDFYSQLGARISLDTPLATFQLWGHNLTNTKYNTFCFVSAKRVFEQHCKPFQIGIDVKFTIK